MKKLWSGPSLRLTGLFVSLLVVLAAALLYLPRSEALRWYGPVQADGDLLSFTYIGNECEDNAVAKLDETETTVTVIVEVKQSRWQACTHIGKSYLLSVQLDSPLGGRAVIDGVCPKCRHQVMSPAQYLEMQSERKVEENAATS